MSAGFHCRVSLRRGDFELAAELGLAGAGVLGIFGPSGAGKTSLLRCLAGLEPDTRGLIRVREETWLDSEHGVLRPPQLRAVGMVFQDARLFPHLNVRDNLLFGARRRSGNGPSRERVFEALDLGPLLSRGVEALSGGEARRVALGRSLLSSPRLLLLDEPLTGLDRERREEILPYLQRLENLAEVPVCLVSHDWADLLRLASEVAFLEQGRLKRQLPIARAAREGPGAMDLSLLQGTVRAYDERDRLVEVGCDGTTMHVFGPAVAPGTAVRVLVQARDVVLSLEPGHRSSMLNALPVTLAALEATEPGQQLARLRFGDQALAALISERSVRQLGLEPGLRLHALIKAAAIDTSLGVPGP